jgi:hypothetical protein
MHISADRRDLLSVMHMDRIERGGVRGALVLAALLSLAALGCSGPIELDPGEAVGAGPEAAAGIVERWFTYARTGQDDSGWSLIHPNVQQGIIGSIEQYREALTAVDWSAFEYEVGDVRLHDGRYHVELHIAGGRAALPRPVCRWGLIQFVDPEGAVGTMQVEIPPFASATILGIGGGC